MVTDPSHISSPDGRRNGQIWAYITVKTGIGPSENMQQVKLITCMMTLLPTEFVMWQGNIIQKCKKQRIYDEGHGK